jgi:hypothetical protein
MGLMALVDTELSVTLCDMTLSPKDRSHTKALFVKCFRAARGVLVVDVLMV